MKADVNQEGKDGNSDDHNNQQTNKLITTSAPKHVQGRQPFQEHACQRSGSFPLPPFLFWFFCHLRCVILLIPSYSPSMISLRACVFFSFACSEPLRNEGKERATNHPSEKSLGEVLIRPQIETKKQNKTAHGKNGFRESRVVLKHPTAAKEIPPTTF